MSHGLADQPADHFDRESFDVRIGRHVVCQFDHQGDGFFGDPRGIAAGSVIVKSAGENVDGLVEHGWTRCNSSKCAGAIRDYTVCPYRREDSLLRVDAVARTSETTDHNGYTQTNSPFDFAGCIPRLPDRRFFLIDIS